VLITFDDGYRDFADHAWPILSRYGLPVTLFVPTAYPDQDRTFWWDRLWAAIASSPRQSINVSFAGRIDLGPPDSGRRFVAMTALRDAIKNLPADRTSPAVDRVVRELDAVPALPAVLGWNELRDLAARGVTLAPHTRSHPMLDRTSDEQVKGELAGSRSDLELRTGSRVPVFAYPSGAYDERTVRAVADAGFEIAFTTRRGAIDLHRADWLRLNRINIGGASALPVIRAQLSPVAVRLARTRVSA
jgi:peptidoglycan/xylan/chitin deacetylase (PgdA/CDA1 family)